MEEEDDDGAYEAVGGSLKLKKSARPVEKKEKKKDKKKNKKKKKKEKKRAKTEEEEKVDHQEEERKELETVKAPVMTAAELAFQEKRKQREIERLSKLADKSHRERIAEFNKHLASLTEHNDLPKIGPG